MSVYDKIFYDNQEKGSLISARAIIPVVMNIVNPKSVIDIGCGIGTWLSIFDELGVTNILGLDGEWVDQSRLFISKDNFISTDLENPVEISEKFDLAISLEVAEHINHENSEKFIKYLTDKAPVVLFSAAVPFQGGTNHINEQWPEYWIKIFKKNNYEVIDCLRDKIWKEEHIEWWYIQNIFLFVEKNYLQKNQKLRKKLELSHINPYSVVHPRLYLKQIKDYKNLTNLFNGLKSQKQECEDKIQTLEKEKADSFTEVKNLFNELKNQKESYDNQLEHQKHQYEEKIQTLEKEKADSFTEVKNLFNELKNQRELR